MNKYEIVYIFRSSLTSEELESKLENFHKQLTREAGQISAVEHWGKRQLAYPIEKERNGNYVVAQFETEPTSLPDFERLLKLDDEILRYLIVLSEGELPTPPSMRRESDDRPGSGRRAGVPVGDTGGTAESNADDEAGSDADGKTESEADDEAESAASDEEAPDEEEQTPDAASDGEAIADPADEAADDEADEERSSSDG